MRNTSSLDGGKSTVQRPLNQTDKNAEGHARPGKTLTHGRGNWLLDLRHLPQHRTRDAAQQRVSIMGSDILEDLLDARIGGNRGEHVDGLLADLCVAIVQNRFENGIPYVHVFCEVRSQPVERLRAYVRLGIVAQGDHEGIAHAVIGPASHSTRTCAGQQAESGVPHVGVERRTCTK